MIFGVQQVTSVYKKVSKTKPKKVYALTHNGLPSLADSRRVRAALQPNRQLGSYTNVRPLI